jgi:peptide/nickel transport system permease protein
MLAIVIRRIPELLLTFLLASVLIFLLMHLAPGDPVQSALGANAQPETVEQMRREYGLDKPLPVQYISWLGGVLRADLGRSILTREPVTTMLLDRAGPTAVLGLGSLVFFVVLSIPIGVLAARFRGRLPDKLAMAVTSIGLGMPNFLFGILLISWFSIRLGWLPISGYVSPFEDPVDAFRHLILPVITLTTFYVALTSRLVRASMIEVSRADFVRTARAKGLPERTVQNRHMFRVGLIPVVTSIAISAAYLLGGAIIVEEIFAIPGLGRLLFTAVTTRDFPLIQGIALLASFGFVVSSLIADLVTIWLDPRSRVA